MRRSRFSFLTTALSLLLLCLVLPPSSAWSVDAFHPDANRERRHVEEDSRTKERSNEDALAKNRESWRKEDLTNRPKQEFHDLSQLEAKIKNQKSNLRDVIIDKKIEKQMGERKWTKEEIQSLSKTNPTGVAVDNTNGKKTPATVYGTKSRHIIVNDISRDVVQISGGEGWRPDSRIQWKNQK